ncbi:MAG: hypothetical protein QN137_06855, partial [Armatimonadota bacterium]|nr:hypothetical protein [Armatimonadota bacterium]
MSTRRIALEDLLALRAVSDVALSPDGRTVAYVQEVIVEERVEERPSHGYRSAIWLVDADGGPPRPFTAGAGCDRRPVWSPDGSRLLFVSDRFAPGGGGPARGGRPRHLWVIARAGGEARRITEHDHAPADAAWSPDGTRVAFSGKPPLLEPPASDVKIITRLRHKADGEGFWDGRYRHIFIVPSDGGSALQVTSGEFDHREPAWSPEGDRLAFVANRSEDADASNAADVWVVTLQGMDLRRLSAGAGPVSAPAWSPDGTTIAYLGHDNVCMGASNTMLWVVPADGSAPPRCLTRHFDRSLVHHILSDMRAHPPAGRPTWSPDGRFVFVMVAEGGTTQLAAVEVATGTVRLLTTGRREIYGESYDARCRRVALAVSDPATPGDIWMAEVGGLETGQPAIPAASERRLTAVNASLLDGRSLSAPRR